MTDDFNLSKERSKWVSKWVRKVVTGRAIAELKQQDREVVKKLKENVLGNKIKLLRNIDKDILRDLNKQLEREIDKIMGKELI